jgi:hypothetical protein
MIERPCELRDTSAETTGDDRRKKEMTADFTRLGMDDLLRAIVMGPRDFDALMRVAAIAALDPDDRDAVEVLARAVRGSGLQ